MIASATVLTVVGSFIVALGLGVIFVLVMMVKGDASVHDLLFPLLFWGYGAVVLRPTLLLAWPIADLALRSGSAGFLSALGAGILLGVLCFTIVIFLTAGVVPVSGIVAGAAFGPIFSGLYWVGAYRANRSTFI